VQQAQAEGADFIKVFSHLNDELLTAIAGEARRLGLPFSGHLPDEVTTERGSELGMLTMEHLWGLVIDTASTRDEVRAQIAANPIDPANPVLRWILVRQLEAAAAQAYDPRRAARLFALLWRRGTVIEPTLHVNRTFYFAPQVVRANEQAKYVPAWLRGDWEAQLGPDWTPEQIAAGQETWQRLLRLVAEVENAGVTVTAGTDCGLPAYGVPGFSMHDELEKLVAAGLSPMRAIQAGTRDAARVAGIGRVAGTVAPGKSADLLIVDRSPLDDIGNLRRIHAVVNRGALITRADRDRMLAEVEAAAQTTPRPAAAAVADCCGRG
jgi:imidazolonepropionase-like amidohydrolase